MKAPRLNRKLTLETPQRESDGSGGFVSTWQSLGSLWAQVTARTGQETAERDTAVSAMKYRIVVRSAPFGAPSRPRPDQRFRDGTRIFHIHAVAEEDPDGRYLTCFATEETAI